MVALILFNLMKRVHKISLKKVGDVKLPREMNAMDHVSIRSDGP